MVLSSTTIHSCFLPVAVDEFPRQTSTAACRSRSSGAGLYLCTPLYRAPPPPMGGPYHARPLLSWQLSAAGQRRAQTPPPGVLYRRSCSGAARDVWTAADGGGCGHYSANSAAVAARPRATGAARKGRWVVEKWGFSGLPQVLHDRLRCDW